MPVYEVLPTSLKPRIGKTVRTSDRPRAAKTPSMIVWNSYFEKAYVGWVLPGQH